MQNYFLLIILFAAACGKNQIPQHAFQTQTSSKQEKINPNDSNIEQQKDSADKDPNIPNPEDSEIALPFELGLAPTDYLNVDEVSDLLKQWEQKASGIATVETYGSAQGYKLEYIRIHAGKDPSPKILIDAATHGDEVISTATILGVAHKLLSGYGRDADITALLKSRDIYIVPIVCPDGYANDSREVEGQDPNRTFPHPGEPNRSSVQCISALRELFVDVGFNATLDYHASGRMMLLPWGYTTQKFSDGNRAAAYKSLGQRMATLAQYDWGQIPDMVGYTAPGGSLDYFYIEGKRRGFNTFAMGVEVGVAKHPARSEIAIEVNKNYQAVVTFIKEAPTAFANAYKAVDNIQWPKPTSLSPYFVPFKE